MKHRKLGRTGLKVSEVSLGTMAFGRWIDEEQSQRVLDAALDAGITLVDTADMYGKGMDLDDPLQTGESEAILGRALKGRRNQIILATKVHGRVGMGPNDAGLSRYHIFRAIDASLKRLQTDYIDLYQVHRFDKETPLEETLSALDDLVKSGKVRYLGCSNFAAWQIAKAHGISALHQFNRFESVQPEYSIITRGIEDELVPFVESEQVGVIVYSPLGRGVLSGKYKQGEAPPEGSRAAAGERRIHSLLGEEKNLYIVESLKPLAANRGWTLAQFALAWVLSNKNISSAILGVSRPEQINDAIKHIDNLLTAEELAEVDRISKFK